jgi:hypothetical protein
MHLYTANHHRMEQSNVGDIPSAFPQRYSGARPFPLLERSVAPAPSLNRRRRRLLLLCDDLSEPDRLTRHIIKDN